MEPLIALFALPGLIWSVLLVRYSSILQVGLIVLIAGTFFGPPFFHLNGPFQISAERVLWCAYLIFFLIHWRLGKATLRRPSRMDCLVLALVALAGITAVLGGTLPDGSKPLARWLFYMALPCGMYLISRGSMVETGALQRLMNCLLGCSVYIALLSVLEAKGGHLLVWPRYIVDPGIWEFYGRGRGPLLNPAANGVLLTMGMGIGVVRLVTSSKRLQQALYSLCVLALLAGAYCTLTRCVWISVSSVIALMAFIHAPRWLRVWGVIASLCAAVAIFGVFKDELLKLKRDKQLSAAESLKSIELRPLLAIIAWEMFQERPLLGHGYGRYLAHNKEFAQDPSWGMPLSTAAPYIQHNIFLSILVDCGLVGLTFYSVLLGYWSWRAWSIYRDRRLSNERREFGFCTIALLLGYVINGMFQDVTVMPMIHMYLFFITGVLEACRWQHPLGSPMSLIPVEFVTPRDLAGRWTPGAPSRLPAP
jgi:O-antigen ligase